MLKTHETTVVTMFVSSRVRNGAFLLNDRIFLAGSSPEGQGGKYAPTQHDTGAGDALLALKCLVSIASALRVML